MLKYAADVIVTRGFTWHATW